MKIVINSHAKSDIALKHLIESMQLCKEYSQYEIIVAIGGYYSIKNYEISKNENITYIKCNHNSIDFTGLITLAELFSENIDEYYLYLHDTCKVGENFYKKIKSIALTNIVSIRINRGPSMNIGIYSQKIINDFKDFLMKNKNTDENKLMSFKKNAILLEDYIFKNDKKNIVLDNYRGRNITSPTDYYNTKTMRIVEYYPNLDLYKIKANWNEKGRPITLDN